MLHPRHIELLYNEVVRASAEGRSPDARAGDPDTWADRKTCHWHNGPAREWLHKPFILPTHLLDRTQPADLGYTGIAGARERWRKDHPGAAREDEPRWFWKPPFPDCPVSHAKNLEFYVLGHRVLACQMLGESRRNAPLLAEVGTDLCWRCRHVHSNGLRCLGYATSGILCNTHRRYWKDRAVKQQTGYEIRDVSFRDIVEKHQNDPGIRSVAGEVAVMRSILDMLLSQVKLTASLNDLDPGSMNAILQTSKMVTDACEKMVTIESKLTAKLSIDQLAAIATTMFNAVVEICEPTPDQAQRLAVAFSKACNPKVQVMVDAETGEPATFAGEMERVKAHPVQERIIMTGGTTAFTETARIPDGHGREQMPPHPPMPPSVAQRLTDMARHGRTWEEQP